MAASPGLTTETRVQSAACKKAGRASGRKELHRVCMRAPPPPPPRSDLHSNVGLPAPNSELYHVSTANSLFMNKKCGRPTKGRSCLCFVKCAGRQNGAARRALQVLARYKTPETWRGSWPGNCYLAGRLPWRSAVTLLLTNPDAYS